MSERGRTAGQTGMNLQATRSIGKAFRSYEPAIDLFPVNLWSRVAGALAYYRDRGRFVVFSAKAVVLATGGIGKAYKITSNSWEYTGDGHALAYDAGAELIDMEFVQFHPTGMVWPPGVRGLLVTEAVRGEGGILRNKNGERFMWKYLPEDRRGEYAATDEEATRWVEAQSAGTGWFRRQGPRGNQSTGRS